jgi:glycosyltransferase involved in cell wall biosynthesis
MTKRKLNIAIMGTRGVPANYGGFETFAEELGTRLAEIGHNVTVYSRHFNPNSKIKAGNYRGINLRSSFTVRHKYLETIIATFTSFLDLVFNRYDAILLCNAANSPFAWIPRLLGMPVCINVDGIERMRSKWNMFGRLWYRLGEYCSVFFATRIVADAEVIRQYYKEYYGAESTVIAYGASVNKIDAGSKLSEFGLKPQKYILYVSRLEPENNALGVIEAYNQLETNIPLVIVGDAPYSDEYKAKLREVANQNVIFTGYQFREAYQELRTNCLLYIQATEVGGTHPALVEAMAYGNCIIANGTPENIEVLGDAGEFYSKNNFAELSEKMNNLINNPNLIENYGALAKERASLNYSWESVTSKYIQLFQEVTGIA